MCGLVSAGCFGGRRFAGLLVVGLSGPDEWIILWCLESFRMMVDGCMFIFWVLGCSRPLVGLLSGWWGVWCVCGRPPLWGRLGWVVCGAGGGAGPFAGHKWVGLFSGSQAWWACVAGDQCMTTTLVGWSLLGASDWLLVTVQEPPQRVLVCSHQII